MQNSPSAIEHISSGSLIIPMDTTYQSEGMISFNLKAYGLINQFLQNGIPVKWAILSGKQNDEMDFSALAQKISPTIGNVASIAFKGGPFIVPDTVLPCGLSTRNIISTFRNDVAIYQLKESIQVAIRYTITHRPKIAVFNNGGNQLIHTKILQAAGISQYDVMDAANIGDLIDCYTFVSEPHANSDQVTTNIISNIRKFVMNGGNFLAQCDAIDAYENRGFFLSTTGIEVVNSTVAHQYHNADLCFSQVHGPLVANQGGSIHNWTLKNNSVWNPGTYVVVSDVHKDTIIAMGGHLTHSSEPGGNVYYLGGHDYAKGVAGEIEAPSNLKSLNAYRLYLNAIFVPSKNSNGSFANAGLSGTVGCSDSIQLGCTPTGPAGADYLWTPSEGLSCITCPNPKAHPSVSTIYKVEVKNGCKASDTVTISPAKKPESAFQNNTVCERSSTSFSDLSVGATFWEWDFGDPLSGDANHSFLPNPTHTFSSNGIYHVKLISGIIPACLDTFMKPVKVNPAPVPKISSPVNGCGPLTVFLKDESTIGTGNIQKWIWYFGDNLKESFISENNIQHPQHTYNEVGKYTIKLQVVSDLGCDSTYTFQDWIEVHPSPSIDLGQPQKICTDDTSSTIIDAGPGEKYIWKPTGDTTQHIAIKTPGTYTVYVIHKNNCTAVGLKEIQEACPPRLFISNSFSPNGDHHNEKYKVYGAHFTNFQMYIFNRWGEVIFESNDKNFVWDGLYNGVPMPIGVYPWIITYAGDCEEYFGPYKLEGSVTVVR